MLLESWNVLCQLAPWLLLGMFLSGLLHVGLPEGFIRRKFHGFGGIIKSVLLGVPLPLCSCGVVPAGIGLKNQGASDGAAVGFLISTPQTGIDSILVSASFFGWPFALFKVLAAAVTGVVGGLLADSANKVSESENSSSLPISHSHETHSHTPSDGPVLLRLWWHGLEIVKSIWVWLMIGVIISAVINQFIPQEWLSAIGEYGLLPAMLLVLAVSTPLYVCATASVPIAASLVAGGLPPAVALVFLMAGPATNVTTIGAIYGRFGWRTLAVYLLTIVLGSMLFAWAFDWLLTAEVGNAIADHHHTSWVSVVSAIFLLTMIAWFVWSDTRVWLHSRSFGKGNAKSEIQIEIEGMTCGGCANKIQNALQKREDVEAVYVQVKPGLARIKGRIAKAEAKAVVEGLGFHVNSAL